MRAVPVLVLLFLAAAPIASAIVDILPNKLFISFFTPDLSHAVRHCSYRIYTNLRSRGGSTDGDFMWQITSAVNGSANASHVSIRSSNFQSLYLCSVNSTTQMDIYVKSPIGVEDSCTWEVVPGLSDPGLWSFRQNGMYISVLETVPSSPCGWYSSPESIIGLTASPIKASDATWAVTDGSLVRIYNTAQTTTSMRHCWYQAWASVDDSANQEDFIFILEEGLDTSVSGDVVVSLRSKNYPQYHLGVLDDGQTMEPLVCTSNKAACTFVLETGKWSTGQSSFLHKPSGKYITRSSNTTGRCTYSSPSARLELLDAANISSIQTSASWYFILQVSTPVAAALNVSGPTKLHEIQPDLYGIFFEEINFAGEGGIYAELIRNRDFEAQGRGILGVGTKSATKNSSDFRPWSYSIMNDGYATVSTSTEAYPFSANPVVLKIDADNETVVKLTNPGFWGISCKAGTTYSGSLYAKALDSVRITVILQNGASNVSMPAIISVPAGTNFTKYTFSILGINDAAESSFVAIVEIPSTTLYLDHISLFPGDAVKGLFRKDLYDRLKELSPAFIRFPGGNYLEGNAMETRWNWKNSIGQAEARPGHYNDAWGYWTNDGLGLYEYMLLCESLNSKPLMSIFTGYFLTGKYTPLNESGQFVQDALDALEWANGATSTTWGAKRSAQGHSASFNLRLLEVGNEESNQTQYREHYKAITDAIWAAYPDVYVIGSGYWWPSTEGNPCITGLKCNEWDEHYYRSPDVMAGMATQYDSYNRSYPPVFVGEYAANGDSYKEHMQAAAGEAAFMIGFERNADIVYRSALAPLFRHVDGTQWSYDMIGYDSDEVYVIPSFFVQKYFRQEQCNYTIPMTFTNVKTSVACRQNDGDLVVKFVNYADVPRLANIKIDGFASVASTGTLIVVAGPSSVSLNSMDEKDMVEPYTMTIHTAEEFSVYVPQYGVAFVIVNVVDPIPVSSSSTVAVSSSVAPASSVPATHVSSVPVAESSTSPAVASSVLEVISSVPAAASSTVQEHSSFAQPKSETSAVEQSSTKASSKAEESTKGSSSVVVPEGPSSTLSGAYTIVASAWLSFSALLALL